MTRFFAYDRMAARVCGERRFSSLLDVDQVSERAIGSRQIVISCLAREQVLVSIRYDAREKIRQHQLSGAAAVLSPDSGLSRVLSPRENLPPAFADEPDLEAGKLDCEGSCQDYKAGGSRRNQLHLLLPYFTRGRFCSWREIYYSPIKNSVQRSNSCTIMLAEREKDQADRTRRQVASWGCNYGVFPPGISH